MAQLKLRLMNWRDAGYSVAIYRKSVQITNAYMRAAKKSDREGVGLLASAYLRPDFLAMFMIPDGALSQASASSPQVMAPAAVAAGGAGSFEMAANAGVGTCFNPCCLDVELKPPTMGPLANRRSLWITRVDFNCSLLCPQRHYRNTVGELCVFP